MNEQEIKKLEKKVENTQMLAALISFLLFLGLMGSFEQNTIGFQEGMLMLALIISIIGFAVARTAYLRDRIAWAQKKQERMLNV